MDPGAVIALDAMGGDHAPGEAVAGAVSAWRDDGLRVLLVGRRAQVERALAAAGAPGSLEVVDAGEVVRDDEEPAVALRSKRDASVRVAAGLVARGRAGALVSAGSTGGTLAAALLTLGRIEGIRRPVVAAVLPVAHGVVLLDAGASADAQPEALVTSARAGLAYARVRGVAAPRVGLLSVGGERGKGNALVRATHDVLAAYPWFDGNVEPAQALAGAVDVVVTDGFTGNIFLKTYETAHRGGDGGPGAALLLGVRGEVLVAHGAADAAQIAAALRTAAEVSERGLSRRVAEQLAMEEG